MSSLTLTEKTKLEKLLDMSSGYVSGFSDTSFGHFFIDKVGIDIHDSKYQKNGTSKAKKLREFWDVEHDQVVGQIVLALVEHVEENLSEYSGEYDKKKPLFEPCKVIAARLMSGKINLEGLKETAAVFDAKHLSEQIRRMEQSIQSDPALAIGTAKELIETCCKTILDERGKPVKGTPDIPTLTKETLKELKLVPEGVADEARGGDAIKRVLRSLGTIGNDLAELRGLYGTGHGKHAKTGGLSARHARLAVGAASTFVMFLFDTHKEITK